MSAIGQVERRTQQRVVNLFRDVLDYDYLGDWTDRLGNRNIDEDLLRKFFASGRAMTKRSSRGRYLLDKAAGNTGKSPYHRNRDV